MKRTRYISLIIALLSVLGMTAQQQQSQYALYNYRNDGDFNAWLNIDIDSITYSNIGLDSIEYDNIVTQEVWTPDSCYRIPIEAIDSIGFRAPEPEFKKGIFHITEEHLPFAVGVDGLTAIFDSSIPSSMLPSVGQVVISDVYDEPFEKGFAGRVVNIVSIDGIVRVECEAVGLEDVYDQLMFVGRCVVFEDDEVPTKNSSTSRKKSFIQIYGDGTWHIPLKKESFTIEDPDAYGNGRAYVGISFSPDLNIDYTIIYGIKGLDDKFKIIARPSVKIDLDYKLKYKKSLPPIEKIAPLFVPVPTPVPGLNCKIRFGAFLEAEGSVSVDGKLTYNIECSGGYDSSVNEDDGFVFSVDGGWGDPKFSVNIEGSLFCGPLIQVFTYLVYEKGFPCVKVNLKPGVDFTGKFVATTDAVSEYGFSAYDMLKESKLTISGKMKADASASFLGHSWECPWKPTIAPEGLKWDYYLFPAFTKPQILFNSTSLHSEVKRKTLFKPDLGLGVYDEAGNALSETFCLLDYSDQSPVKTYIGHDMSRYAPGKYIVRPIINNWFGFFKASPVTEFTVPELMFLEKDALTLQKGKTAYVAINGGWGNYSAHSSMRAICSADIETINDMPYVKLVASKRTTGSTTVTVKDLRSGETKTILVTVSNDAIPEELTLSEQTVSLQVDESTTVLVLSGGGSYTAESSDENVATAIVEDEKITVTAIGTGSATITVTDVETEETATIEVTVKEAGGDIGIFDVGLPPSTALSPEIQWEADMMVFNNGEVYSEEAYNQVIGTPPSDIYGNEWYARNYQLTDGQESWSVGKAPFSSDETYSGNPSTRWTTYGTMADIYLRRTFTVNYELSDKILFSCCHDDAPAEWYLNGVLIRSIDDGWNYDDKVYLTPEQCALIHTDGTKNVMAIHVHNNWGGAFADGGLYDEVKIPVEIGLPPSTTVSPDVQWKANMMVFNGGKYASDVNPLYSYSNQVIGTPPSDAQGNEWYARNYQLTDGEKSWGVGKSPFYSYATYKGKPSTQWTPDWYMADIYLRRYFVVDHELSDKIMFSCSHDDAPAEWYLNGVLIRSIEDGCDHHDEDYDSWTEDESTYLTPEQRALIYTDGRVNVLAIHVHNNWGVGFADGGFYEVP